MDNLCGNVQQHGQRDTSVPVGFGPTALPMGMQVIGKPHADFAVLQMAFAYEQVVPLDARLPAAAVEDGRIKLPAPLESH